MAYALRHQGQVSTASGLDVLAGIWLLISPFVLAFHRLSGIATSNDVVLGIIIGLLALGRLSSPVRSAWMSWINVVLGIWVLISPWVLGFGNVQSAVTNNVIMGIIVIILAGWSALATDTSSTSYTTTDTMPPRV
jgi:hypothetical protein